MKKNPKQIIFAILAIGLVLAGLEGFSRLYDWLEGDLLKKVGEETLAIGVESLNPYVFSGFLPSLQLRPHEDHFFDFNRKNVRAYKDPDEYRIFILGGSVAKGYGASLPEKAFNQLLEKKLSEVKPRGRKFNVISAGYLGYVSAQELILLMMGVLDFKPDLVIHLNGANDIMSVVTYHESPGYPFYFQTLKRALEAIKIGSVIDQGLDKSYFFKDLKTMYNKYHTFASFITGKNIVRNYKRNMTQSAQLLKANGTLGVFILQPILLSKKVKVPREQEYFNAINAQSIQFWGNTYPNLEKSLKEISNQESVVWKNLNSVFDEAKEEVFIDFVHLNDRGQELLADVLFETIRENVLLKSKY